MLVKRGTLRRGEFLVAGRAFCRVRVMRNDFSEADGVDALRPAEAAEVQYLYSRISFHLAGALHVDLTISFVRFVLYFT